MKKSILPLSFCVFLLAQGASLCAEETLTKPFDGLRPGATLIDFEADMDGDGIPDWLDDDIDGDGISNDYEIRLGFDPRDPNSTPPDLDGDGIPDALDPDIDGDGVPNELDAFPYDPTEWSDMDGDGVGDNSDPDIDGDGISNEYEILLGFDPRDPNSTPPDMDGDGVPDALDPDIDGDGVPNELDAFPYDPTEWADTDGDGVGDNSDPDIDGDGFTNEEEIAAGTDPYDKNSFPDYEPPVIEFVDWQDSNLITGMAYDDGMGIAEIWLQSPTGDRCQGKMVYANNFEIRCPQAKSGGWKVIVEDRAGNRAQKSL